MLLQLYGSHSFENVSVIFLEIRSGAGNYPLICKWLSVTFCTQDLSTFDHSLFATMAESSCDFTSSTHRSVCWLLAVLLKGAQHPASSIGCDCYERTHRNEP